ncbi:putative bifunctional diguanylate cyclase/phosphodiesterase [Shewanella polaris]|uniref:putative bifunctional diguanylate cyclase/phosphodiesterase n=1 Tax=Shewanella polaris TaxID=2588449 RepID=UPI00198050BB|nr:bifunctional diguanylate cyclase/phosphodiesterase [Shewanella polaris]
MSFLNTFFLLNDDINAHQSIPNWRISALRIILTSGLLLCLATALDTFSKALQLNYLWIIALTIGFTSILLLLLLASKRFYYSCAHLLLIALVLASLAMNLTLPELALAQIGSMLMFVCPAIALMLLGRRVAIFYALLNIVPFYMMLHDINLSKYTNINQQLPDANWYITGVIFVFFNICIPLAVARTIVAAKRLNKTTLCSNAYLKSKNDLYRTFFTESTIPKIIVDDMGMITDANQQAIDLLKLPNPLNHQQLLFSSIIPNFKSCNSDKQEQILQLNNTYQRVEHQQVTDSDFCVYEFHDCSTEQHIKDNLTAMEEENKRLRYRDTQTQLPNRDWFELQCNRLIAKYRKGFYVVVAQSANNDYLNIKFGNHNSQTITQTAFKRLRNDIEGPLLCAHIGPGKIAFILGSPNENDLYSALPKIKHILDKDYNLLGIKSSQSFLFGIAHCPEHGDSSEKVVAHAVEALKLANTNEVFSLYNETNSQSFLEKYEISMLLDEALQQGELSVHYQPKVTNTGKCIGLEALSRWNSPILGSVSPAIFIPIAEEYRMISRLTDLVVQKVCSQINQWTQQGFNCVPVAINISLIDFSQSDFISKLVKHLADFAVSPNQIELELTETSLEANQAHSLILMKTLQSWGFTISVDDFGVGYSNIARLADYPINKLKLDRSLISQITTSDRQQSLVRAIHNMCEELSIKCVSEGVETAEQVRIMADMGCKEFQGFYFSKPITPEQFFAHVSQKGLIFEHQDTLIKA